MPSSASKTGDDRPTAEGRSDLFPDLAGLEKREQRFVGQISSARQSINKDKSTTRTSAVDDASKTIVNTLKQNLKEIRSQMGATSARQSPSSRSLSSFPNSKSVERNSPIRSPNSSRKPRD